MAKKASHINEIFQTIRTVWKGMRLSFRHLLRGLKKEPARGIENPEYFGPNQGPITIQYPSASVPIPDNGRYRLHMETEDCIACDKCARICPVDCITIESFKAEEDLGKTSDGTVKRLHLPTFDIDMGKCMFCGLCTTVCPTECLTMTKVYDFSEYDRDNLVYHFGAMDPEEEKEVRERTEAIRAEKKASAARARAEIDSQLIPPPGKEETEKAPAKKRPVPRRKPVIEKPGDKIPAEDEKSDSTDSSEGKKKFTPRRKPVIPGRKDKVLSDEENDESKPEGDEGNENKKIRRKPLMKKRPDPKEETPDSRGENTPPKPRRKPVMKKQENPDESSEPKPPVKPRSKPIMKPKRENPEKETEENQKQNQKQDQEKEPPTEENANQETEKPKFRPRRKPIMKKPKPEEDQEGNSDGDS